MLKLKALLLTQGMHGMVSQAEGLAKALNLKFQHHTIRLKKFWNFIPPILTPISENLLTEKIICDSRIIISLSLIHISEPTRPERISYAVFCLKKKKKK